MDRPIHSRQKQIPFTPKGVIFDVDDTLLDNYPVGAKMGLHERARFEAIRTIGKQRGITELIDLSAEQNRYVTHRSSEHTIEGTIWQLFYELGLVANTVVDHSDPLLREIADLKNELYLPVLREYGEPLHKAVEFVQSVYMLTDGAIAIASGAARDAIDVFLAATGLDEYFLSERIISRENVTRAKPDPQPFAMAFETLGLDDASKGHVIAFEDDPKGVASAKAAGLYVCAITSRFTAEEFRAAAIVPDQIADTYVDFAAFMGIEL